MEVFIKKVFGFLQEENLTEKTDFKQLSAWNSLNATIIHHHISKYFGVELDNLDYSRCVTIKELYDKVCAHAKK